MKHWSLVLLLTSGILPVLSGEPDGIAELKKLSDPALCRDAMNGKDPVLRRAAFRRLLENPETFRETALSGMADPDPLIRRRSLYEYGSRYGDAAFPQMKKMAADSDPQVIALLIAFSRQLKQKGNSVLLLKLIAEKGATPELRRQASKLVNFTFYRENKRLKDNPAFDHEIMKVKSVPLSLEGWRFRVDPMANGHEKGFFKEAFDDSRWKKLKIGAWEEQGYPGYDGIAWYRLRFHMPEKIDSEAVELAFGAVDESAWVWLNGVYIGQHDIGPNGWNRPFALDVTKEIRWNAENLLVVRVEDTTNAGGIWKPVAVEVLK